MGGYSQPPQVVHQVVHHHHVSQKSAGTAAMFELLFGGIFQTFGIGHIYAGNPGVGIAIMFGYWIIQGINIALMAIFIGFLTWPVCWLLAVVLSTIGAVATVNNRQKQTYYV
jgi:TM2 domain-containing membrane protein YozV